MKREARTHETMLLSVRKRAAAREAETHELALSSPGYLRTGLCRSQAGTATSPPGRQLCAGAGRERRKPMAQSSGTACSEQINPAPCCLPRPRAWTRAEVRLIVM